MALLANIVVVSIFVLLTITSSQQTEVEETSANETTQRLPERNAIWRTIRADKLFYADKTPYFMKLLQRPGKLWFLTRPRRFGKSLFVDMMDDYFRGNKDAFCGLTIETEGNTKYLAEYMPNRFCTLIPSYKKEGKHFRHIFVKVAKWKWMKFPVISLNFDRITNFDKIINLKEKYINELNFSAALHSVDPPVNITDLIQKLHLKFNGLPVMVLVDEYDYPFEHALMESKNRKLAEKVRSYLDGIYTEIKNCAKYLGLAFVTGISRLGLMSLESGGPNAFVDLTFEDDMAEAFGLTKDEIYTNMKPHLKEFARREKYNKTDKMKPEDSIMKDLIERYSGYCFSKNYTNQELKVLSPISAIGSIGQKDWDNYWCNTGSIDGLVERFHEDRKQWRYEDFQKGITLNKAELTRRVDPLKKNVSLPVHMLIIGYATIKNYDNETEKVMIELPNNEIKEVIRNKLEEYVPSKHKDLSDCRNEIKMIYNAMESGNVRSAMEILGEYEFIPFSHRSSDVVTPPELARRIQRIFCVAGITYQVGFGFSKDGGPKHDGGNIDFLTLGLDRNYAISVKCGKGGTALDAIDQLIKYFNEDPKSFTEGIQKRNVSINALYFMGLSFTYEDRGQLRDWIAVPYRNDTLKFGDVEADSDELKDEFLKKYATN